MAIFNINVNNNENAILYNQILYMISIILLLNILLTIGYNNSDLNLFKIFSGGIFNLDFINIFIFILLGILIYNLIVKKIIIFI